MAWATAGNISTANLDAGTRSPSSARADLKAALDELIIISNNLGVAGGAVKHDTDNAIIALTEGIKTASGDFKSQPASKRTAFTDLINLNPIAYATMTSVTPAKGDVFFLTTDGAGSTKNKLVYYDGSAYKYVVDDSTVAAS